MPHSFPTRRSSDLQQGNRQHLESDDEVERGAVQQSWPHQRQGDAGQHCPGTRARGAGRILERGVRDPRRPEEAVKISERRLRQPRSEEHTSELQSLMRISYAVFCLKKKKQK